MATFDALRVCAGDDFWWVRVYAYIYFEFRALSDVERRFWLVGNHFVRMNQKSSFISRWFCRKRPIQSEAIVERRRRSLRKSDLKRGNGGHLGNRRFDVSFFLAIFRYIYIEFISNKIEDIIIICYIDRSIAGVNSEAKYRLRKVRKLVEAFQHGDCWLVHYLPRYFFIYNIYWI